MFNTSHSSTSAIFRKPSKPGDTESTTRQTSLYAATTSTSPLLAATTTMPPPEMQQRGVGLFSTTTASSSNNKKNDDPHTPSSIPPWVHAPRDADSSETANLLTPPPNIRPNTRHYKPPPAPHNYKPGRKWDHLRSAEPPFLSAPINESQARWTPFMASSPYPGGRQEGRVVDEEWMATNMGDLHPDWRDEDLEEEEVRPTGMRGLMYKGKWLISPERQERTVRLFWRLLLKNPFVPLFFRLAVLAFSAAALGIAASIYTAVHNVNKDQDPDNQCASRASTFMAVSVGCFALPYIGYVTWDEYMSKPLGLRSVPAKVLLLLCDLYFVTFAAANLSLAFDALTDHRWACYDENYTFVGDRSREVAATCPNNMDICNRQKALSGVLLFGLVAWLTTFSISVLRVVEKLRPD